MSIWKPNDRGDHHEQHTVIFADRESITPSENDLHIKQLWIDIYNENISEGAVQSNGTILWDCPCLGTQAIGPCSSQFRAAFSCYQNSTKEPKGSECMVEYMKMQHCFTRFPKLYGNRDQSNTVDEIESSTKLMNHPEARRYRTKQAKKKEADDKHKAL